MAFSQPFLAETSSNLLWALNSLYICLMQKKNLKSKNFCFLDLNLPCFKLRQPSWKILQIKIFFDNFVKKQKFPTCLVSEIIGGPNLVQKMHVFSIFWRLDGVENTRKCRFWTRSLPKHRHRHLTRLSTPQNGKTLRSLTKMPNCYRSVSVSPVLFVDFANKCENKANFFSVIDDSF